MEFERDELGRLASNGSEFLISVVGMVGARGFTVRDMTNGENERKLEMIG